MKLVSGALLGKLEPQARKAQVRLDLIEEKKQRLDLCMRIERRLIYELRSSFMKRCRSCECCTFTDLKILGTRCSPLLQITEGDDTQTPAALMAVYFFPTPASCSAGLCRTYFWVMIPIFSLAKLEMKTVSFFSFPHYFPQQRQISSVPCSYRADTTFPWFASVRHLSSRSRLFVRTPPQVKRSRLPKAPAEMID